MKKEQGFTMIELLLVLGIVSLCALLFFQLALLLTKINQPTYDGEDMIAIRQLRWVLAQAEQIRIQENSLVFSYHGKDTYLIQYENKLVKRPGFEVFLQDIDQILFHQRGNCFIMEVIRNEAVQEAMLACE